MSRALLILLVLFVSCGPNSGQSIYLKEVNDGVINRVSENVTNKLTCSIEEKIWYKLKSGFCYKTLNSVVILDDNCNQLQKLNFDGFILDLAVSNDFIIVSTTMDEIEIYESELVTIDLKDFTKKPLEITNLGAKFSLSISDSGNLLSFIHQDVRITKQVLKIYDLRTNEISFVDEIRLGEGFFINMYSPPNSDWRNDQLYFTKSELQGGGFTLLKHDLSENIIERISTFDNEYSQYFQVDSSGDILFYKQGDNRFKSLVLFDLESATEKVVYEAKGYLSDLITFSIETD